MEGKQSILFDQFEKRSYTVTVATLPLIKI